MRSVEIDKIIVTGRQRSDGKSSKDLLLLKKSIVAKGLIHAPLLCYDPIHETFTLIAGERRLLSMKELHQDGLEFKYDTESVLQGHSPYSLIEDLHPADLAETELEENVLHAPLSWQEECQAKVMIHNLRKEQNPQQTLPDTAKEFIVKKGDVPTETAVRTERRKLVMMQALAPHLNEPMIKQAKDIRSAYDKHLEVKKKVLERELIKLNPEASPHKVIHGDLRKIFPTLEKASFDVIISDPPYGINAHQAKNELAHNYDDTPDYALSLYREILRGGFHLLKPKGSVFLFCDFEHFPAIRVMAEQQAYSTFRTPFIWHKGTEGYAPWGRDGWKRTYECLLYCVKGERSLALHPGGDVRTFARPTRNPDKMHAAEKPLELLRYLIQISCRAGDKILDPCCGSGPIFQAAQGLGVHITGIEMNDNYHAQATSRLLTPGEVPDSIVDHERVFEDEEELLASMAEG